MSLNLREQSLSGGPSDRTPMAINRHAGSSEQTYSDEIARRKLTLEQVEAVAQGRVWTGQQAKQHGLVDELGGMRKAVERARAAAGLPADEPVQLVEWPPRPWWRWPSGRDDYNDDVALISELQALLAPLQDMLQLVDPARDGLLVLPGFTDTTHNIL